MCGPANRLLNAYGRNRGVLRRTSVCCCLPVKLRRHSQIEKLGAQRGQGDIGRKTSFAQSMNARSFGAIAARRGK